MRQFTSLMVSIKSDVSKSILNKKELYLFVKFDYFFSNPLKERIKGLIDTTCSRMYTYFKIRLVIFKQTMRKGVFMYGEE